MPSRRMSHDHCSGCVDTWIRRKHFQNTVGGEADILKSSRPPPTRVSKSSIFDVASYDSFTGKGGAEVADVRQVICGLPETPMDHEQEREWSSAAWKAQLSEVLGTSTIVETCIEGWWRPLQNVAQASSDMTHQLCPV